MNPYRAIGCLGFAAAVLQTFIWSRLEQWPWRMAPLLSVTSALTFVALLRISYVLLGHERIVFLEHLIAIVATTFVTAKATNLPVARSIDVVVLGVGTFLVFGRVGCCAVGCCVGRPSRFGVQYGPRHVLAGLHAIWAGQRLFPVQIVESLSSAVLVAAAFERGGCASVYLLGYAIVRFFLEFLRGDLRPELLSVSEAQWLSMLIAWGVSVVERSPSTLGVALLLTCGVGLLVAFRDRLRATAWGLGHAAHVLSLETQLERAKACEGATFTTNRGIELCRLGDRIVIARPKEPLTESHLRTLARWIRQIARTDYELFSYGREHELRPRRSGEQSRRPANLLPPWTSRSST